MIDVNPLSLCYLGAALYSSGFAVMTVKPHHQRPAAWLAMVQSIRGDQAGETFKAGFTDAELWAAWEDGLTRSAVITRPLDPT